MGCMGGATGRGMGLLFSMLVVLLKKLGFIPVFGIILGWMMGISISDEHVGVCGIIERIIIASSDATIDVFL